MTVLLFLSFLSICKTHAICYLFSITSYPFVGNENSKRELEKSWNRFSIYIFITITFGSLWSFLKWLLYWLWLTMDSGNCNFSLKKSVHGCNTFNHVKNRLNLTCHLLWSRQFHPASFSLVYILLLECSLQSNSHVGAEQKAFISNHKSYITARTGSVSTLEPGDKASLFLCFSPPHTTLIGVFIILLQ